MTKTRFDTWGLKVQGKHSFSLTSEIQKNIADEIYFKTICINSKVFKDVKSYDILFDNPFRNLYLNYGYYKINYGKKQKRGFKISRQTLKQKLEDYFNNGGKITKIG